MVATHRIGTRLPMGVRWGAPVLVALALLGFAWGRPVAADDLPGNLLDRPMSDVAVLPAVDDATPDLLVLEASDHRSRAARVDLLQRAGAWEDPVPIEVDLGEIGLSDRWLVALAPDRYALVATNDRTTTGNGHAIAVLLSIEGGDTPSIHEAARQTFDRAIEAAGAADVDGFGSAELVLATRTLYDKDACGTTSLIVVDGTQGITRRVYDITGRLGSGVLGRFDGAPGDDLVAYAGADCAPGGSTEAQLTRVNLASGAQSPLLAATIHGDPSNQPVPLRVDLDGTAPDELVAMTRDGLALVEPRSTTAPLLLAGVGSVPLIGGATGETGDGVRLGILDSAGSGSLVVGDLRRQDGTVRWQRVSELAGGDLTPARWGVLSASIEKAAAGGRPSNAWSGDAVTAGCADLVLPGAIMPCGTTQLRSGAAWLATTPVASMTIDRQRDLLIAAGVGWDPAPDLPPSPTPLAAGPAGWWRRGPSIPFVLSELRSEDLVYFREFPTPAATIESTTASDGSTALPGFTGARLFTRVTPLETDQDPPTPAADLSEAFAVPPGPTERLVVSRVPVPPGLGSGRDGSFARLGLGDVNVGNGPTSHWALEVVPINDWGEWGTPVSKVIARDVIGPTVDVEDPFLSPIWPFTTRLGGRTDPGSTIKVDGVGALDVDKRGRFTISTPLAPWPQAVRVTSTDEAGNTTIAEFTVVGGIDYRRFPWPGIAAAVLLLIVAIRGLIGGRRDRAVGVEATRWSTGALDEGSMPEIEDLPPGHGLPAADHPG